MFLIKQKILKIQELIILIKIIKIKKLLIKEIKMSILKKKIF